MSSGVCYLPDYQIFSPSTREYLQNFVDGYFDLNSSSTLVTTLKVISYATPLILVMWAAQAFLWFTESSASSLCSRTIQQLSSIPLTPSLQAVLDLAPPFADYRIGKESLYPNTNLTAVTVRPANLFFNALLGTDSTTMPGSGKLFAFHNRHKNISDFIYGTDANACMEFSARGVPGNICRRRAPPIPISNLADLYGPATYRMSYGEIQSTLKSQKIHIAPLLPVYFYQSLKHAMLKDGIVVLPGNDKAPAKLTDLKSEGRHCYDLIQRVYSNYTDFGFTSLEAYLQLLDLTLYQLGSLVVKSEDFRIFLDAKGKIRNRAVGERDAIRLINACGIRGILATSPSMNRTIMTQAFKTSLQAAESGFVVFPAVGMGVWGSDPDLYWRAFLDAVVLSGGPIEKIFINPGHPITPYGRYRGCKGEEFQTLLDEYRLRLAAANDANGLAHLAKIVNLYESKKDVAHLSHALKVAFPDKIVSLFNASDPDVTLGNHVGEYGDHRDHASTTEKNYAAMGTKGLCFEGITGVHSNPACLIQAH